MVGLATLMAGYFVVRTSEVGLTRYSLKWASALFRFSKEILNHKHLVTLLYRYSPLGLRSFDLFILIKLLDSLLVMLNLDLSDHFTMVVFNLRDHLPFLAYRIHSPAYHTTPFHQVE